MEDKHEFEMLKLENQLCFPLYAASRKITNKYIPFLKPFGITYTQYIVFLVLWEEDGITVGEIGKKLHLDNGTLTPMLKKLEESDWILRKRSRDDERVVIIKLTEKGYQLKYDLKDIPEKMAECVDISHEDAINLYHILYEIIESI